MKSEVQNFKAIDVYGKVNSERRLWADEDVGKGPAVLWDSNYKVK